MRITKIGSDYIEIDEETIKEEKLLKIPRVHLIKLCFEKPTDLKVKGVLELFPKTNRFVIEDNIKIYNNILKFTSKKYYVENTIGQPVITFFKKNNKVLVNFNNFSEAEQTFFSKRTMFEDVLRNTEVIVIHQDVYEDNKSALEKWSGNVIIDNTKLWKCA
jgi:hypothetical protein